MNKIEIYIFNAQYFVNAYKIRQMFYDSAN